MKDIKKRLLGVLLLSISMYGLHSLIILGYDAFFVNVDLESFDRVNIFTWGILSLFGIVFGFLMIVINYNFNELESKLIPNGSEWSLHNNAGVGVNE